MAPFSSRHFAQLAAIARITAGNGQCSLLASMLSMRRFRPRYPCAAAICALCGLTAKLASATGAVSLPTARAAPLSAPSLPLPGAATGIDLQWDGPPECPDAARVRRDTERLLGQPLGAPRTQHISARARVRKNDQQNAFELELSLTVNERTSDETLIARSCSSLADATALKLALTADPFAVIAAIGAPVVRANTEPIAERTTPRERPLAEPEPSWKFGMRIVAGANVGPLPTAAPAGGVFASLQLPTVRFELGAQASGPSDARYASVPDVGAHLQLFSGIGRACVTPALGGTQFPICGGFELGSMRGEGFGAASSQIATSTWGAVIAGPAIRLPVMRNWSIWLEADAILPVVRPGFHFRNLETLYVSPAGASRGWGGIEMVLP